MYIHQNLFIFQAVEKEYKKKQLEGSLNDNLKFSYAWHLIKSKYKNDVRKGIGLMEGNPLLWGKGE